jgi:D-alanyl-D-alanine dipeptidase
MARNNCGMPFSQVASSPDFIEILPSGTIAIDLRYGSPNNFVGRNLYGDHARAYLHRLAAAKLQRAAENLGSLRPGFKLLILDALRPRSVQFILWEKLAGTPEQQYVADPRIGSIHNYGFAIDLTIIDEQGRELDMGTAFDDFHPLAQTKLEGQFLADGTLSQEQWQNRLMLRSVMEGAGFIQLPIEWWHYDALPRSEVTGKYLLVE